MRQNWIIDKSALILITGANGFVGSKVFEILLEYGFKNIRCMVRSGRNIPKLERVASHAGVEVEFVECNLLSRDDCRRASSGASIIFHLAAGTGKSFAGCFMDSVVATRNLLDATLEKRSLKRFVSISSLAVHSGSLLKPGDLLDETCPIETDHMARFDPYCFGKIKEDELVMSYGRDRRLPYVIVRPGPVYGPGKDALTGRAGIDTFGFFICVGGSHTIPIIFVDNCAEAIVLAGLAQGANGKVLIAVDDDLPTSAEFVRLYQKHARPIFSIRIPYRAFFLLTWLWERYSKWSEGQLPPVFNRRKCAAYYQMQKYSNRRLKEATGWTPRVSFEEACRRYFEFVRAQKELS